MAIAIVAQACQGSAGEATTASRQAAGTRDAVESSEEAVGLGQAAKLTMVLAIATSSARAQGSEVRPEAQV